MNETGRAFYDVSETARALRLTPKEILKLISQGTLKARPGEQTGEWLIEARSVRAYLRDAVPKAQRPEVTPRTSSSLSQSSRQDNRVLDLLVLVIIGITTLSAAGYTLLPVLLGGESTQPSQETSADTTAQSTPSESTTVTATVPDKTVTAVSEPTAWVNAIGDSVMLGAVEPLQQKMPNLGLLNAQGSRQPSAVIDILQQWRTAGYLGDTVVIDIGNNGLLSSDQFDEMMRVLAGVPKVLVVSLTVPPGIEDPVAASNNVVLAEGVQRYPNAVLVDWHAASAEHPEFLGQDNIHLTSEGAQAYADLIASQLGQAEGSVEPPSPLETTSWGEGGFFGECVGPSAWCAATATS